jgi:hypothetical protein
VEVTASDPEGIGVGDRAFFRVTEKPQVESENAAHHRATANRLTIPNKPRPLLRCMGLLGRDMYSKKAKDYTGVTAGGYLVLRRDENHDRRAQIAHWRVKCVECGREKVTQSTYVRTGKIGSCECKRQPKQTSNAQLEWLKRRKIRLEEKMAELQQKLAALTQEIESMNGDQSSS